MRKAVKFLLLAVFLSSFLGKFIFAQEKNYNEKFSCLAPTYSPSAGVASFGTGDAQYQKYSHSAVLTIKESDKPLANSQTYVIECLQVAPAIADDPNYPGHPLPASVTEELASLGNPTEVCTTGDSAADMFVYNNDRLAFVKRLYSRYDTRFAGYTGYTQDGYYQFDYVTKREPESTNRYFMTDANSNIVGGPFAYINYITGPNERKFLAYNRFDKLPEIDNAAGVGALQQNDLQNWTFDAATKRCIAIAWDPYGVVFDAQTLEPIPGASVALYVKSGGTFRLMTSNDMPGKFIQNPMITKEDGRFSFIVPDGIYKLAVTSGGYTFPSTLTTLHSNASVIYSDIYRGEEIIQSGKMQHRDIPLDVPQTSLNQKYQATLMGAFQTLASQGETNLDGRVSHPFARINSYCKDSNGNKGTVNTTVQADKNGIFSLTFDPQLCDQSKGEMYGIVEVESIDLTGQLTNPAVSTSSRTPISYNYNPILNHVEGYAMDRNNSIIPNAEVGVYILGDKNPQNTIKADENGRFKFSSNELPNNPYELRYVNSSGSIIRTSTTQFIKQNLKTILEEKINLYSPEGIDAQIATMSAAVKQSNNNKTVGGALASRNAKEVEAAKQEQNNAVKNQIVIILFTIGLIVVVGAVASVVAMRKRNAPPTF